MRDPVVEYANWLVTRPWSKLEVEPRGSANAGGFFYRGSRFPEFADKLVLGDVSTRIDAPACSAIAA